ncbi:putative exosome subunit [Methanocella conradii HZ254]|uniref:Exosome subunit n=1 Tax=Methanocella conradii (strain DSM 24694 / JCM 17849 / CGMCC 1.5162 / HZ254) TaxID=1041930 RepID=H8IA54_METCZ|nr:RNA-binding domain-containing protein [Methanocella conradii]AFC99120.1 putative exosome subunit [Methanocella conradii HZ254]MDI6896634.1 RNA-binding domain-containing protein [Methanocella conradii]
MIHYILFRTQSHATEDVSRVRQALVNVLPPDTPIKEEETRGYFDNPITVLTARLEKKAAEEYVKFLKSRLLEADLKELVKELPERVSDDCDFYLKLSKQDAYLGDIRLTYAEDVIAIRAKVAAYPARREAALKVLEEYFNDP